MKSTYTSDKLLYPKTPNSKMLEVFDAARRAQNRALALSILGSVYLDKGFGHALDIDAAPEAIGHSMSQMHEKTKNE